MDWKLTIPLLITALVTSLGWYVAHRFNVSRDRENKLREQRLEYLVEAFHRLGKAVHHPRLHEVAEEVQSALADIQLFGSEEQIVQATAFAKELSETGTGSLDELLNSLRNDLRRELNMPITQARMQWLRISPTQEHRLIGKKTGK